MSMLRESLLNSLFTSSIPPTSLTVRVTLLLFFFLLSPVAFMCALHLSASYFVSSRVTAHLRVCLFHRSAV